MIKMKRKLICLIILFFSISNLVLSEPSADSLISLSINPTEKCIVKNTKDTTIVIQIKINKGAHFDTQIFKTIRLEASISASEMDDNYLTIVNDVVSFKNDSTPMEFKITIKPDSTFHINAIRVVNLSFVVIQGADIVQKDTLQSNLLLSVSSNIEQVTSSFTNAVKDLTKQVDSLRDELTSTKIVVSGEMSLQARKNVDSINVYKQRKSILNRRFILDHKIVIDSICINHSNGFFDAFCYSNGALFKNTYPVPLTNFSSPKKRIKKNYSSRLCGVYPDTVIGTFIVPQSFVVYNQYDKFLPSDTIFTLKDSLGFNKIRLVNDENLNRFVDVKIYTDALGLSGKPNGLLQTEVQPRFTVTNRRLIRWLPVVFLHNFSPGITLIKFDSKFGKVYLNNDSTISDRLTPVWQSYLIGSVNLNIMKIGGSSPTSHINVYLDFNARVGGFKTSLAHTSSISGLDSLGNPTTIQKADTIEGDSHFVEYGLEFASSISISKRFSTDFAAKVWWNRIADPIIKNGGSYVYYNSSFRLNFITDSNVKTNRLFIRYRVGISNNWDNVFHQLEFGYSTSILSLFPSKSNTP